MDKKPQIKPELVNEFVGNAHGNLQRVKELLEQEPALLNAAWDWGGGDWETGLGAAAHTGQAAIAQYLLERGAHLDIFAAAMLGRLDIVQAIRAVQPNALTALGPHGIPLLIHAEMGGQAAAAVVEFIKANL